MPIPDRPTYDQFAAVAGAISPGSSVISTRKLRGGLGCRMDVVEFAKPGDTPQQVVTRLYWEHTDPNRASPNRREAEVLQLLEKNGVPAPTVSLDPVITSDIFGKNAIALNYLDGGPGLKPSDPHDWAGQLATALARVHNITVPESLLDLKSDHSHYIQTWCDADEPPEKFTKHPLGVELWQAMRYLWPHVDKSAKQLIHTDFWPGNTIWNDEELIAIVDWEWPFIGEPTQDVAYFLVDAQYFGMEVEQAFLEVYQRESKHTVKDLDFWKMTAVSMPMPDPGHWAQGYAELGIRTYTADDIRAAHTRVIEDLLARTNA